VEVSSNVRPLIESRQFDNFMSKFILMRVVIQRVSNAQVEVTQEVVGKIGTGLLVFVGIEDPDQLEDVDWLVGKVANLRIFNDAQGVMNLSVKDINGEVLVISQFTLHASTKKGNRPSYIRASKPEHAIPLYELFKEKLSIEVGKKVEAGIFGADMKVTLLNDGPVTITMDTKNKE
jgi:D-aminoacyl-tRNA deacylase